MPNIVATTPPPPTSVTKANWNVFRRQCYARCNARLLLSRVPSVLVQFCRTNVARKTKVYYRVMNMGKAYGSHSNWDCDHRCCHRRMHTVVHWNTNKPTHSVPSHTPDDDQTHKRSVAHNCRAYTKDLIKLDLRLGDRSWVWICARMSKRNVIHI